MARRNNRTAKKQKQPKKQQTQSKRMLVTRGRGLDPYGVAYARLLADPCNAALCSPIFGVGENGGYLLRVFSLVKLATGVGETEAALLWSPGLLNAANQNLVFGTQTSAAVAINYAAGSGPGVSVTCNSTRCVAACLEALYVGNELSRSGTLALALTPAGTITQGAAGASADQLNYAIGNMERIPPSGGFAINWVPTTALDQSYMPYHTTITNADYERTGILAVASGLPAGVGIVFKMTAVYEWFPAAAGSPGPMRYNAPQSKNTLAEVIEAIQKAGKNLFRMYQVGSDALHTFMPAMQYVGGNARMGRLEL